MRFCMETDLSRCRDVPGGSVSFSPGNSEFWPRFKLPQGAILGASRARRTSAVEETWEVTVDECLKVGGPMGARFLEHPLTSVQKRSQSGKFNVLRWCLGYLEAQLAIISNHFSPCHGRHTDLCSCKRTSARARLANLPVCWATRA